MAGMTVITTGQLASHQGLGSAGIKRRVRAGELVRIRRGFYLDGPPRGYHDHARGLVVSTAPLLASGTVVSHTSAALMHGLPVERALTNRVWVIRTRSRGGPSGVVVATDARIEERDVIEIDGLRVTSMARTVLDLARTRPFDWGVAAADAALRAGLSREALERECSRFAGVPGIARGRMVVGFADERAESPGESRSRAIMQMQGLLIPVLQHEVRFKGRFLGRSDFAWPDQRVLGEFDGAGKYAELVPLGHTPADVIMAEKEREQAFRDAGWWVVRWGWRDLADHGAFADRLRGALNRR